jgi:hypothetical protein
VEVMEVLLTAGVLSRLVWCRFFRGGLDPLYHLRAMSVRGRENPGCLTQSALRVRVEMMGSITTRTD